jgi:hypothetical protein
MANNNNNKCGHDNIMAIMRTLVIQPNMTSEKIQEIITEFEDVETNKYKITLDIIKKKSGCNSITQEQFIDYLEVIKQELVESEEQLQKI